ncbi:hypothetical protein COY28_05495 [Candidatus Woesearchaeota archaeon CG_4_10_14_0_2_um_filter_57_5]|nr:MAG: hypothetical protein AUJ68_00580 [Candidatus Woesearchaeota archaeon CG1_02_57_44]PIN70978.1 MAG: hypothetical protein COV94_00255 [Candidatus Woesearchaeota archaeon CG11_big_fil_rev_8_21_14_0_20_57_5]PIZ50356.1 MAG: hypothetical protein COY28_05495 [Candidatus Woesearchaeota archaeon CG_4_10_14_0_2_um_filter_57_5]
MATPLERFTPRYRALLQERYHIPPSLDLQEAEARLQKRRMPSEEKELILSIMQELRACVYDPEKKSCSTSGLERKFKQLAAMKDTTGKKRAASKSGGKKNSAKPAKSAAKKRGPLSFLSLRMR